MRNFLPILLLFNSTFAIADWEFSVNPEDSSWLPGKAFIKYLPEDQEGLESFDEALAALKQSGNAEHLHSIILHALVRDPAFQNELRSELNRLAPEQLAEAERSSGNMHNPNLVPLNKILDEVVLAMPTIQGFGSELASEGLRIDGASHEKLFFWQQENATDISFMLWLGVTGSE
jgi:hypothetical protein